jgi:hypothetical protein
MQSRSWPNVSSDVYCVFAYLINPCGVQFFGTVDVENLIMIFQIDTPLPGEVLQPPKLVAKCTPDKLRGSIFLVECDTEVLVIGHFRYLTSNFFSLQARGSCRGKVYSNVKHRRHGHFLAAEESLYLCQRIAYRCRWHYHILHLRSNGTSSFAISPWQRLLLTSPGSMQLT